MKNDDTYTSRFGMGFTYCLGLFLAHKERRKVMSDSALDASLWFLGAADHLTDMVIPYTLAKPLHDKVFNFRAKCMEWRTKLCKWQDVDWALNEASEILLSYDKLQGVPVCRAEWD